MNPLNNILLAVGAVIALALGVALLWLSFTNAHLRVELAQAQENITACHLANDEFAAQVAQQNKAVEAMKAQTASRDKRAQAMTVQAQKYLRAAFLAASKIRRMKAHGNTCQSAENVLNDYLGQPR